MNNELLDLALKAGRVQRYHTLETVGPQENVAAHTYGVLIVLDALLGTWVTYAERSKLMRAALYHDAAEAEVGDLPYVTKQANPELREMMHTAEKHVFERVNFKVELEHEQKLLLKIADLGQMAIFAKHQLNMGNRYYLRVLRNATDAVEDYILQFEKCNQFGYSMEIVDNCNTLLLNLRNTEEKYRG